MVRTEGSIVKPVTEFIRRWPITTSYVLFCVVLAIVLALAGCAPVAETEPVDLEAVRQSEAERLTGEVAGAATEPVVPVDELEARMLALEDARTQMYDRHQDETRDLEKRQAQIEREAADECMQPTVDRGIDAGVLPEGTVWSDFEADVYPGVGNSMDLEFTQGEIDTLDEAFNGDCFYVVQDVYEDLTTELADRHTREERELMAQEEALWSEQAEAYGDVEDEIYEPGA